MEYQFAMLLSQNQNCNFSLIFCSAHTYVFRFYTIYVAHMTISSAMSRTMVSFTDQYTLKMRTMWNAAVNRNIHKKNCSFFFQYPNQHWASSWKHHRQKTKNNNKKKKNTLISHSFSSVRWTTIFFTLSLSLSPFLPFAVRYFIHPIRVAHFLRPCVHLQCSSIFINVSYCDWFSDKFYDSRWKLSLELNERHKTKREKKSERKMVIKL